MNKPTRKKYPKLFKTLSRIFGARRARKIIRELEADGHTVNDTGDLLSAFTWKYTRQGHRYWADIDDKTVLIIN